ncbi:MAG: class B sortase [Clostridiales bacterium]|nr:class B sortase [Clostridiales bacterium]
MKTKVLELFKWIFIILILCSLICITKWKIENNENRKEQEEFNQYVINSDDEIVQNSTMETLVQNSTTETSTQNEVNDVITYKGKWKNKTNNIEVNFKKLKEINSDVVGYIKVNNTNIKYPVVRTTNNTYYLTHNFEKKYNSAGWIFMDYRNTPESKNTIIYGHNRLDGTMFAQLKKCLKASWYNNSKNLNIVYNTENEKSIYKVFSIYKIENENYYIQTSFEDDTSYEEFINKIKSRSVKNFNVNVTSRDKILTLSTCSNRSKYRIVIHAVKQ